ncbi:hypothetical protein SEA_CHILL_88 [Mycobacterium phage Chill]|nr:gp89 [Mycobacterium phage Gumball]ACD49670.1 hypothetical protein Adjutor_85 [Mycobacterium phage Adjutor]ACI06373.1 hypothetical protein BUTTERSCOTCH_85 [Mycobacterium phage Butterscotch]ACI88729.1 hypothetical protein TROLL4_87 [Mycobacterium phage Troll4]AER49840.1 hypothetical protein NOVA_87 [Mycobacterium phage Nova]AVP43184.1 hypothetical protein PBI_BIGMAMA_86 [Mycobacterium phage BigMama]AWY03530.1 hypothetical protein ERK16_88 [Mycobacterium phage Erk16]AXC38575.1 hypothetical p
MDVELMMAVRKQRATWPRRGGWKPHPTDKPKAEPDKR